MNHNTAMSPPDSRSTDPRRHTEIVRTNVRAAEVVLGRAVEAGLDPVVHISSTVALARRGGSGPDLPLGDMAHPYSRSKIESEKVARALQREGHPVVSVYPGAVLGPHDPYRGDQAERVAGIVRGLFQAEERIGPGLHVVQLARELEKGPDPIAGKVLEPELRPVRAPAGALRSCRGAPARARWPRRAP